MKNIFLIVVFLWSSFAIGQNGILVPPENIRTAFDKQHPKMKPLWTMEYTTNLNEDIKFIANFMAAGKVETVEVYDSSGNLKATKTKSQLSKLPLTARNYLKQNYSAKSVKVIRLVIDDKKIMKYEAEAKKEGKLYYVNFDKDGNFIGRTRIG